MINGQAANIASVRLHIKNNILPGTSNPDKILIMKIRSLTYFLDPAYPINLSRLDEAGKFIKIAQTEFLTAGYEVETTRLATPPFPNILSRNHLNELSRLAQDLEHAVAGSGFAYVSLGPAATDLPDSYRLIPEALAATQNTFCSGALTTPQGEISLQAVHRCAEVIQRASVIYPDGFANLRFAALANVPAGSAFFPAAYHEGEGPAFALATEAADLAVRAFSQAANLEEARHKLVSSIEENAATLTRVAYDIEQRAGVRFGGIDFSLAPFPSVGQSIGTAMEQLGVSALGLHGSLAAAAILADTIDQAQFPHAGFSGLFLPVLEDAILAQRAAEGSLSVKDLLLYSAVCGTGLDTIPLPGDTSIEALASTLLDLAALSCRLEKPLTARLMPIPGKKAGDLIRFEFAYFASSRVMALHAAPLRGILSGEEIFTIHARPRH